MVEAQHITSTLKLVDNLDEQSVLEEVLEGSKPLVPVECQHLCYLFAGPFRYGSAYPYGSRFRRAGFTAGVYYASEYSSTAIAEIIFYRMLFFIESPGTPWPTNATDYSAIEAAFQTSAMVDLTNEPYLSQHDQNSWTDCNSYEACQALAEKIRDAGGEVIRYLSVRDPQQGKNLALLSGSLFTKPDPVGQESWRIKLSNQGAVAIRDFPRKQFEIPWSSFGDDSRYDEDLLRR